MHPLRRDFAHPCEKNWTLFSIERITETCYYNFTYFMFLHHDKEVVIA